MTYLEIDEKGNILDEEIFEIKGPVCDDITMFCFLKSYAANRDKEKFKNFYLLTNEPKLYKVDIKNRGTEDLKLPIGTVKAIKLQLMADLGPVTEIAAKIVPPTYFWYKNQYPYDWLQYEGKESGLKSANVVAYLTHRSPPVEID